MPSFPTIDVQTQLRLQLEKWVGKMAREVIGPQVPERLGFAFIAFDFESGGSNIAYCSNARRDDMARALAELLGKWRAENCIGTNSSGPAALGPEIADGHYFVTRGGVRSLRSIADLTDEIAKLRAAVGRVTAGVEKTEAAGERMKKGAATLDADSVGWALIDLADDLQRAIDGNERDVPFRSIGELAEAHEGDGDGA